MGLIREESACLTHEINVALGTLQMHYESADPTKYKLSDAVDALMTFMRRTKDTEQADLNRKYSVIHTALLSALWTGLPSSAILPPGAMRANQQFIQPTPQIPNSGFWGSGRGNRHSSCREGFRGNSQRPRGQPAGRETTQNQPAECQMIRAVVDYLQNLIQ